MKPVILFVDDEPNILSGLRRSLLKYRNDWDMMFVSSGAEGLEVMGNKDIDIIVSDMRMPQMDGVEFLNKAKKINPATVRIILSGHADKDALILAANVSHRYISKPCEQSVLVETISRSVELVEAYKKSKVHNLLLSIHSLPSPKAIWQNLEDELKAKEISINKVADIITSDVSLSAKVLQLANNAYYSTPMRIYSAQEAVNILGIDIIASLALNAGIVKVDDEIEAPDEKTKVKKEILCQSMTAARLARDFAKDLNLSSEEIEKSSTISMLNNIGRLFLVGAYQNEYVECCKEAQSGNFNIFDVEQRVFGITHDEIGAYLMSLWGLPDDIPNAILSHHNKDYLDNKELTIDKALPYIVVSLLEKNTSPDNIKSYLKEKGMEELFSRWERKAALMYI